MKRLFILLLFLAGNSLTLTAQDRVAFKLQFSEVYATYDFLTRISGNYPDNALKIIYENSKYDTGVYRKGLADFEKVRLNYTYTYDQYPIPLKVAMMSMDLLEKNLATSSTVDEFKSRSIGIIPNEDLLALSGAITLFQPVYRELVAEPNKAAIAVQQNNLLDYVESNRFSTCFETGLLFYNTVWDKSIPFELNLLPSLEKDNLGARAFFNIAICEAMLGLKDHKAFFSVAMHEIYHILYDNQSLELKGRIQQWFDDTGSPNSQYALLLLNEVLATCLGNAYIMEQLNGHIGEDDWYGNNYIAGMSKAIYPTVKQYLESKKPMDEDFVKKYVQQYDTRFPGWNKELMHLFMYRYIVTDTRSDWQYFRKTFRFYSYNRLSATFSVAEIEKAKRNPLTKAFVISENHRQKLDWLQDSFEELRNKKWKEQEEFVEVVTLKDRTKLWIINRHQATVDALMRKYFPGNRIE